MGDSNGPQEIPAPGTSTLMVRISPAGTSGEHEVFDDRAADGEEEGPAVVSAEGTGQEQTPGMETRLVIVP
jgi:hypothetical protein